MDEAMRLHLWIVSCAFRVDNRSVLEALHNHAHGLNYINSRSLAELYTTYDKAVSQELELKDKGIASPVLAITALRCLINNDTYNDFITADELHFDIQLTINAFHKVNNQFRVKKA